MKQKITLGDKVRDRVTDFEGIAISKVEYLNGCIQFCVKPKQKKGENTVPEGSYIDQEQLEVVKGKKVTVKKVSTGGDMPDCPKS